MHCSHIYGTYTAQVLNTTYFLVQLELNCSVTVQYLIVIVQKLSLSFPQLQPKCIVRHKLHSPDTFSIVDGALLIFLIERYVPLASSLIFSFNSQATLRSRVIIN